MDEDWAWEPPPDYVGTVLIAQKSHLHPLELFDLEESPPPRRWWRIAIGNVVEAQGIAQERIAERYQSKG